MIETFPFRDDQLDSADFPRKFPFSAMVPKVYHQVKEFIYAGLKFCEDLHPRLVIHDFKEVYHFYKFLFSRTYFIICSQKELEKMIKKSTTLLLSKTFSSCLSNLFQRPHLTLFQVTQILIDTSYLEKSSVYLEEFVFNITG